MFYTVNSSTKLSYGKNSFFKNVPDFVTDNLVRQPKSFNDADDNDDFDNDDDDE